MIGHMLNDLAKAIRRWTEKKPAAAWNSREAAQAPTTSSSAAPRLHALETRDLLHQLIEREGLS